MADILELIDNAISDYVSDDAMRWTPEPPPRPMLPDPVVIQAAERIKLFLEAFAAMARQIAPMLAQVNAQIKGLEPTFWAIDEGDRRAHISRMHAAYRRRRR